MTKGLDGRDTLIESELRGLVTESASSRVALKTWLTLKLGGSDGVCRLGETPSRPREADREDMLATILPKLTIEAESERRGVGLVAGRILERKTDSGVAAEAPLRPEFEI